MYTYTHVYVYVDVYAHKKREKKKEQEGLIKRRWRGSHHDKEEGSSQRG
jgi:hypothetical protein